MPHSEPHFADPISLVVPLVTTQARCGDPGARGCGVSGANLACVHRHTSHQTSIYLVVNSLLIGHLNLYAPLRSICEKEVSITVFVHIIRCSAHCKLNQARLRDAKPSEARLTECSFTLDAKPSRTDFFHFKENFTHS